MPREKFLYSFKGGATGLNKQPTEAVAIETDSTSAVDDETHIARGPVRIAANQEEYTRASSKWFSETTRMIAMAANPILSNLSTQTFERVPKSISQDAEGSDSPVEPQRIAVELPVVVQDLIDTNIESIHMSVFSFAESYERQLMSSFISAIDRATEASGNVISGQGRGFEAIVEAFETMHLEFDRDGNLTTQILLHPDTLAKLQSQSIPDELRIRLDQAIESQRREYFASRRHRRLPRHGD